MFTYTQDGFVLANSVHWSLCLDAIQNACSTAFPSDLFTVTGTSGEFSTRRTGSRRRKRCLVPDVDLL